MKLINPGDPGYIEPSMNKNSHRDKTLHPDTILHWENKSIREKTLELEFYKQKEKTHD
jgi:hypothetical protein